MKKDEQCHEVYVRCNLGNKKYKLNALSPFHVISYTKIGYSQLARKSNERTMRIRTECIYINFLLLLLLLPLLVLPYPLCMYMSFWMHKYIFCKLFFGVCVLIFLFSFLHGKSCENIYKHMSIRYALLLSFVMYGKHSFKEFFI